MKTRIITTAMLMAMFFGSVSIEAQTARRSATKEHKEQKERVAATRSHTRSGSAQKARTTQSNRQVQNKKVQKQHIQKQRATQPARQIARQPVQKQKVQRSANTHSGTSRNAAIAYRNKKPVSISTPHNPKSNYRKADSKVYVKHSRSANTRVNKYSTRNYYGGNHYHYAYPTRKVKFHYHHDTYMNNYHVLYYPTYNNIYWTRNMYRDYRRWYPHYNWRYKYGYSIQTMSVFDAKYNMGEVAMVYGRVYATWHNKETDDYLLFFGGDYPYQQFTVVLPGNVARRFSWKPERYFLGEHMTVTGLITTYDGIPEIVVKNKRQVGLY